MAKNKVVQNAKWIIACKIAQSVLQLIIGMISARYLGPSNYGLISYAASVVGFVLPIMQLGLRSTLVQEFIETPEKEGQIIGTSLVMNLVSSLACMVGVGAFVAIANRGEEITLVVCLLYSLTLIFQAIEMIQYWFQYKLLSKYPSIVMLISYVVVSAYKIFLLVSEKGVYWFVLSNSIDFCIIGFSLFAIYFKLGGQKLGFSFEMVKRLYNRSKFYIVSAMMVTIFANTDHIMLKIMLGDDENGFYAAAITCATVANFVYGAIIDSMRPVILSAKKESDTEFEKNTARLYCVIIYLALAQSIAFTIFAKLIVSILYGAEYMASVPVLQILIWYTAFSFIGTVRNIWILAEGKQSLLWIINLSGAVANVILNIIFIPLWGACGAAVASVLTQFFTNVIVGFIMKPIRPNNRILIQSLNPALLKDVWIKFFKK